ncbi:MAG: flagellar biosynthesis protein FliQ [Acidobacteriota bacterium]|nr:flagellar biosynthesis protein FliQ [Acidobacteriota bacterium]
MEYVNVATDALWLVIWLSLAPLLVSLIVGLLVSFFQALTQIQEQTLTFVPKIIATILTILILAPTMMKSLMTFSEHVFELMTKVSQHT